MNPVKELAVHNRLLSIAYYHDLQIDLYYFESSSLLNLSIAEHEVNKRKPNLIKIYFSVRHFLIKSFRRV